MKFIPMLFSTPMTQALLDGTKTQTRRTNNLGILNAEPQYWAFDFFEIDTPIMDEAGNSKILKGNVGLFNWVENDDLPCPIDGDCLAKKCPYIKCDIIWVRETFGISGDRIFYRADNNEFENAGLKGMYDFKWKPNMFMPKEACRIFLEVTNIRCERLLDISEQDSESEGIKSFSKDGKLYKFGIDNWSKWIWSDFKYTAKDAYFYVWDKINGKEAHKANPWVWVIEFKKIDKPLNFA